MTLPSPVTLGSVLCGLRGSGTVTWLWWGPGSPHVLGAHLHPFFSALRGAPHAGRGPHADLAQASPVTFRVTVHANFSARSGVKCPVRRTLFSLRGALTRGALRGALQMDRPERSTSATLFRLRDSPALDGKCSLSPQSLPELEETRHGRNTVPTRGPARSSQVSHQTPAHPGRSF